VHLSGLRSPRTRRKSNASRGRLNATCQHALIPTIALAFHYLCTSLRKRQTIYTFMLLHLSDEHKFQLMSKLSLVLLAAAVEGELDVREERPAQLVADTLFVLSSKVRVEARGPSLDPATHTTRPRLRWAPFCRT